MLHAGLHADIIVVDIHIVVIIGPTTSHGHTTFATCAPSVLGITGIVDKTIYLKTSFTFLNG